MKKLFGIALLVFLSLGLSGCFGYHRIIVTGNPDYIDEYPKRAKAGETVRVYTVTVTDADVYFHVNGADYTTIQEGIYEFVMPDHDVEISLTVKANGLA